MKIRWMFPVAVLVGLILGFAIGQWTRPQQTTTMPPKLKDYCGGVSVALAMDADAFEHGTDSQKLDAAQRFGEQVTFHSEYEILLCAKKPVDLDTHTMCEIGPNYECLAKLARAASEATKP